jgi:Peptidase family M1 domain/Carboxypeptidase regulatory-like domain
MHTGQLQRLICLTSITLLLPVVSAAISVTISVQDPDGRAVPGAAVNIQGRTLTSDSAQGTVSIPDLPEGSYLVSVRKPGFETAEQRIEVKATTPASFTIRLKIPTQTTSIQVRSGKSSLGNSDPNYVALRSGVPGGVFHVENLKIRRDVGTFQFTSGDFSFGAPVLGKTVIAVFTGEGVFRLKPTGVIDSNYLKFVIDEPEVVETFHSVVLCFTDETADEIRKAATERDEPSHAREAFQEFRNRIQRRGDQPRSMVEALLGGEEIPNVDADLLRDLYAGSRHSFYAYIHGAKHADLRFTVSDSGALPQLSPEETGLVSLDENGGQDGIWYLNHLQSEQDAHTASSSENRRWVQAEHYKIDTVIAGNDHLSGTCDVRFKVLVDGTRVVRFGLLPALRVKSVKMAGQEIEFIQEDRKKDGSFYAILPSAARPGNDVSLTIEYDGDKVVRNSGNGSFSVQARTAWYPNLNTFTDRAAYDLTFHVPKPYTLVSIGRQENASVEGNYNVSHWVTDTPVAVAGFNFGAYRKVEKKEEKSGYQIEVYAGTDVPGYMQMARNYVQLAPSAQANNTLIDSENSVKLFNYWFGNLPYGRLAVTEQPQMFFGQSWPSLVYLPLTSFMDSTQRYELFGEFTFNLAPFIDQVTPHEISHQWFGHAAGWATYHDLWLSEGFASFAAGLFLDATGKHAGYLKFMQGQREQILEKSNFGIRRNDAGPLWLGLRLMTWKAQAAYFAVVYAKGGYVLEMLRSLMWDPQTKDQAFIDMMHDYMSSGFNKNLTTEDFRAIVTKHMTPVMDMAGDHTMNWFFDQWVYGTEIPKYRLEYSVQSTPGGKTVVTGKLTQSEVSDNFRMKVPVYAELDKKTIRLGLVYVEGNSSSKEFKVTLPQKPKRIAANLNYDILAAETINEQTKRWR